MAILPAGMGRGYADLCRRGIGRRRLRLTRRPQPPNITVMDDTQHIIGAHSPFRALTDSAIDPLLWEPVRRGAVSTWWGHVPFAHWLVGAMRPRVVVELGTHNGVSYSAFCRAVERYGLSARCF